MERQSFIQYAYTIGKTQGHLIPAACPAVLYKYRKRDLARLQGQHPAMVLAMWLSHEGNQRPLAAVCHALETLLLPYDCVYRGDLANTIGRASEYPALLGSCAR